MLNLSRTLLVVGAVSLIVAVISKLANLPLLGSFPTAIMSFSAVCLLLTIALLLLVLIEKR
ncbi:MAG: hypothetical protein ABIJ27_00130 [Candidatus Omnitrophota bacterium]